MRSSIKKEDVDIALEILSSKSDLTREELSIIYQEAYHINSFFDSVIEPDIFQINTLLVDKISKIKNLNGHQPLNRLHSIAKKGCLASNLGIYTFASTLIENNLIFNQNSSSEFVISQGHVAPAFYVAQYVHHYFPLTFLLTLHQGMFPGVVTSKWGFQNEVNRPLGMGLADCVGRALHAQKVGDQSKNYSCLIGDGELQEGIVYELLGLIQQFKPRVDIVININKFGIGDIELPPDYEQLIKSFGFHTQFIDAEDSHSIKTAYSSLDSEFRKAILLNTQKGIHTHLPSGEEAVVSKHSFSVESSQKISSAPKSLGKHIQEKLSHSQYIVLCPDAMNRFGFTDKSILNSGMRENASIAVLKGFPDKMIKMVATDDQFLIFGMAAIEQLFVLEVKNFWLLASKSWGIWNGSNYFVNLILSFPDFVIFEPSSEKEISDSIDFVQNNESNGAILTFDFNIPVEKKFKTSLFKLNSLQESNEVYKKRAVVAFGAASTCLDMLSQEKPDLDFYYCNTFPLPQSEIDKLGVYDLVYFVEFNRTHNGLGKAIMSKSSVRKYELIGADNTMAFSPTSDQLKRQGLDIDSLRQRII